MLTWTFAQKTEPSSAAGAGFGEQLPEEWEGEADSESRLIAVLALLIPLGGVAWAGIGWLVYQLVA